MSEIEDLRFRLKAVERGNRLTRLLVGVLLLVLAVVLAPRGFAVGNAPPKVPDVVRAHAVEIVSKDGKVVVRLADDQESQGGTVVVYDKAGERRGWLRATQLGGHLMIAGPGTSETAAVSAMSVSGKHASIVLGEIGVGGWAGLELERGLATMTMFDRRGKIVLRPTKGK